MLAIFCDKPGLLSAKELPKPHRGEGEVLVRIRRIGVCGTDLHIFTGNQPYLSYPRIMGHELSGTVEEAPDGSALSAGDIVTIIPYISCGHCSACLKGKSNCCRNIGVLGVHRDGGMLEYLSVPQQFVLKAEGLSLDQAAMTEFLAIGAHAVRRGAVKADQHVLIVGAGPIGMAVAVFAVLNGSVVTMIDSREDRLAFCKDQLGVSNVVILGEGDKDQLSKITGGDFFDAVFDATGNPKAMERGFSFVGHGGSYVLVSIVASDISFNDPEFHKRETTLLGSRNATLEDFEVVLEAQRSGKVPEALITHRMTLVDVPARFADLTNPKAGVIKGMVEVV
ncbi:zinc-binding alcohol dehydrogenase family protein [Agrobacterium rosae]|uniref:Dehydrogenase n=1 Tax=Agrobacterium rosae TaxID=1972867 RepID=A0AAE5RU63_9HYPH|nr:zinc-binding alcohol dehydrogenase family protein [Agrobacterium rosae]KAA3510565.1 dehydrogenase [Agrobacterium rosae]KAA3517283.1 dehydrogenase [Agrobacterium rosae]MCM2434746.1 zinc-binding alcohol dehydrogenase family protein [Agrobacterium rosae]MDX8330288.1 zinc-binding alcohol dehydrogenase family protein [Agrobacterium rosae]MQB50027.1 dehydrogenase [Agrobacterium rosae]